MERDRANFVDFTVVEEDGGGRGRKGEAKTRNFKNGSVVQDRLLFIPFLDFVVSLLAREPEHKG